MSGQGQAMVELRSDEKVQTRKMTMNEKDKSWSVLAKAIGEVGLGAWTERDSPQRGLSFYVLHFAALYFPLKPPCPPLFTFLPGELPIQVK